MPATQILVIGRQGSGKSTGFRNVDPAKTIIITPNAKPLPWEGSAKKYVVGVNRIQTNKLTDLPATLKLINDTMPQIEIILVEDLTHYMSARTLSPEFTSRKFGGDAFAKWGEFGADVANVIMGAENFRDNLTIVYHGHTEIDDEGQVVLQTAGKLLDRDIKLQSYFTYVLHCLIIKQDTNIQHKYLTNNDGVHEAKTPMGCFPDRLIDNDIKVVIERIHQYQGT